MRHTRWMVALALLVACNVDHDTDGVFRVGCTGDSSTEDAWPTPDVQRWCALMPALLPTVSAYPHGGTTASPLPTTWQNVGQRSASLFDVPIFQNGFPTQLGRLAANTDAVIAAFGTNDSNAYATWTPQQAIAALQDAATTLRASDKQLWVATAPPSTLGPAQQAWQAEFNALVQATFCEWIDFTSGFDGLLEADGIHITAAGQLLRAQRVADALTNTQCPKEG